MKPKPRPEASQLNLFQAQFDQLLNLDHPLCVLARKIDWQRFDIAFADCYCPDIGAPGKDIRLLVGLHDLKHTFNESDESLLERWVENPYWQYFCGFETMQHELPLHSTSLTKWRQRVGADRLVTLLEETVTLAISDKHVTRKELAQVIVDTTVQEKNITHPTDSRLYLKALEKLADAAKHRGVQLRQTYRRVAKKAAIMVSRYAHAKQFKRMRNRLKKLRTWLGRVLRDLRRKVPRPDFALCELLTLCERLHAQEKTDSRKLYSLHEPDVMCISKGKAHKRYEFGQKVSVTTTNRGNWIVGVNLCRNNPYDGHTLAQAIATTEQITRVTVTNAFVDKGYRGHDYHSDATIHIAGSSSRKLTRTQKKRRKRRSAVEPKIGHLKSDNRMGRCFLKGLIGDEINAVLAAAGSNLQKLLRVRCFSGFGASWTAQSSRNSPSLVVALPPPDRVLGRHRHGPQTESSSICLFQGRLFTVHPERLLHRFLGADLCRHRPTTFAPMKQEQSHAHSQRTQERRKRFYSLSRTGARRHHPGDWHDRWPD